MKNKSIVIIAFSDLARDPRVRRQIHFLRKDYQITAVGFGDPKIEGVNFIKISKQCKSYSKKAFSALQLLGKCFETYYWSCSEVVEALKKCRHLDCSLYIANDIEALPLCVHLAKRKRAKILFDAHEYAPLQFEDVLVWKIFYQKYKHFLCKKYLPFTDAMITVCEGIAKEYEKVFGIPCEVVNNAKDFQDLSPTPCNGKSIRMICHGAALPSRKYENLIEVMRQLDHRFQLDFVLLPSSPKYVDQLKRRAAADTRIRFLDPLPHDEIVLFSNGYDLGIYHLTPHSFNQKHALPNKFFEYIQSRLALAFPPMCEIAPLIKKYQCGVVADNFKPYSLAEKLNAMDAEKINELKASAHIAAQELCSEINKSKLRRIVSQLLVDSFQESTDQLKESRLSIH